MSEYDGSFIMIFCHGLQSVTGQYVCLSMSSACVFFSHHLQIAEFAVTVYCHS